MLSHGARTLFLGVSLYCAAMVLGLAEENKSNPNSPFVFTLYEVTAEEKRAISAIPEVKILSDEKTTLKFSWQPYAAETWESGKRKPTSSDVAMRFFPHLASKKNIGKHNFESAVSTSIRGGNIVEGGYSNHFCCGVRFNDVTLRLFMFSAALPGQVEHEMLRRIPGLRTRVEKCGPGHVVVAENRLGIMVVWQVSGQAFALIYNSYPKDLVTAYVRRWGSITPAVIDTSIEKWAENEIRWRFLLWKKNYLWRIKNKHPEGQVWYEQTYTVKYFFSYVAAAKEAGVWLDRYSTLDQEWRAMKFAREWLWANRSNFKYDEHEDAYVLKEPDRYVPGMEQDFPDELEFPFPEPTEVEIARNVENFAITMIMNLRQAYQKVLKGESSRSLMRAKGKHENEISKIPDAARILTELKERATQEEVENATRRCAEFLWANRQNLVYDGKSRRYSLKGPDLYDPEKPPELPAELNPLSPWPKVPEKSEMP